MKTTIKPFFFLFCSSLILILPLSLTWISRCICVVLLFSVSVLFGSTAVASMMLLASISFLATVHTVLRQLFGPFGVSPSLFALVVLITTFVTGYCIKKRVRQKVNIGVGAHAETILLLAISLLFLRWPLSSIGKFIGFLKYEDNAAWLRAAAGYLKINDGNIRPLNTAAGGHVLDYLIGFIHAITALGDSSRNTDPVTAFITVANTYMTIGILSCLFIALISWQILKKLASRDLGIIGMLCVVIVAYPGFVRPSFEAGTLSLSATVMSIWAAMFLVLLITTEQRTAGLYHILLFFLFVGIGGMWWPAVPISVASGLLLVVDYFYAKRNSNRLVFLVIPLLLFCLLPLIKLWKHFFTILSFRSFFTAQGGVLAYPEIAMALIMLSVGVIAAGLWTKNNEQAWPQSFLPSSVLVFLAIYAWGLYIVSLFVGPLFSPNYSVKKLLLLLFLVGAPLVLPVALSFIIKHSPAPAALISPLLALSIGLNGYGINLNSPRTITEPMWTKGLISVARKYPGAIIVCSSSRDDGYYQGEAYMCSRHAGSLMQTDGLFGLAWRNHIVTPGAENYALSMSEIYEETKRNAPNQQIIVLSLEPQLSTTEPNSSWMMQLPWKDLTVVDASSGLEIYDNDLMLKVDFLPATTTITGPFDGGFLDRVYESGSETIIEGWATWSESEPSIGLRGARESDLVIAVTFPRADVVLPGARGFRIVLRNSIGSPIPMCLLVKKSTNYFSVNGPDSKC